MIKDCDNRNWGGARNGAGRPVIENKAVLRSIRANDEEWEMIKANARAEGKSIARYIIDTCTSQSGKSQNGK